MSSISKAVLFLFACVSMLIFGSATQVKSDTNSRDVPELSQAAEQGKIDLDWFLRSHSKALKYYYTCEEVIDPKTRTIPVFQKFIDDNTPGSIDGLVRYVNKNNSGVIAFVDQDHPDVVHVVDRKLFLDDKYWANMSIPFTYSGSLGEVHDSIGNKLKIRIRNGNQVGGSFIIPAQHFSTTINITSVHKSFRSILTDASLFKDDEYGELWSSVYLSTTNVECKKYGYPPIDYRIKDDTAIQDEISITIHS